MEYTAIFTYFNRQGNQKQKEITRKSEKAFENAMVKFAESNELAYYGRGTVCANEVVERLEESGTIKFYN